MYKKEKGTDYHIPAASQKKISACYEENFMRSFESHYEPLLDAQHTGVQDSRYEMLSVEMLAHVPKVSFFFLIILFFFSI